MDKNRIFALLLAFNEAGIEIVKTDIEKMKIFLIVPKEIKAEKVKHLVRYSFGEQMRVFVKEKGET